MAYTLLIKKQAKKMLQSLSRPERNKITEKIMALGKNPNDPALDIKSLQGVPYYRLRIGDWRVIYDRDDSIMIISIEKIRPRGGAYK